MIQKTFVVHGMKCQHCQSSVESALRELAGVKDAQVSLVDATVTIDYDEGMVSVDTLKEAVEGAGRFEFDVC